MTTEPLRAARREPVTGAGPPDRGSRPSHPRAGEPAGPRRRPGPGPRRTGATVLLGRQPIFTLTGATFGYELLYRSAAREPVAVDTWSPRAQDRATQHVVETALHMGLDRLCGPYPAFVNGTRSLLLGHLPVTLPPQVSVEIVESVTVDEPVLAAVRRLRADGHLIAIDDFTGTPDQVRALRWADIVKIDLRDLRHQGPDLLDRARSRGALVVVERVETVAVLEHCRRLGVDLIQGNLLGPALVLRGRRPPITAAPSAQAS